MLVKFLIVLLFLGISDGLRRNSCSQNYADPTKIIVVLLLPKDNLYLASYYKVAPAIKWAIDRIREKGVLPGLELVLMERDTACDPAKGTWEAMRAFIEYPLNLFLGPSCDYVAAPVARLLKFIHIPMITAGALAYDFGIEDRRNNESEYHMLVRTGWSFYGMSHAIQKFFEKFKWRKMAFLYQIDGRPEVIKDHYCYLAIQAVYDTLFLEKNCTIKQHKLMPDMKKEHLLDIVKREVGTEYASK
ncbi:atrial natriuretic peptide receptor 3 [Parasteatoda tepidariorum]|uniref:atrial natriuretic peptide receptor 3 n=1 Tax=Parasteatoda tepidariorum TaxID=114398 RepID=UPI00077FD6FE|nr:atrial natriuretic peptide receptor 3-like [Parasteatoda tepidariorum]